MKQPPDPVILDVLKVIRERQRFALNQARRAKRSPPPAPKTPPLLPPPVLPPRPPAAVIDLARYRRTRPGRPLPPDPIRES